jgi:hypothetical protein
MRLPGTRALIAALAVAAVGPAAALAVDAKPVSPVSGASVTIKPKAGFANGDAKLTWSIAYPDCPGPDSIHSSYVEIREPGYDWRGESRGGPFLGDGTFTALTSLFPGKTARKIEWRVFWGCGATDGFAGMQGRSAPTSFVLQPASACAGLVGAPKARCTAKETRDAKLKACAAIKAKAARDACSKRARDAYAKAIAKA